MKENPPAERREKKKVRARIIRHRNGSSGQGVGGREKNCCGIRVEVKNGRRRRRTEGGHAYKPSFCSSSFVPKEKLDAEMKVKLMWLFEINFFFTTISLYNCKINFIKREIFSVSFYFILLKNIS